MPSIEDLLRSRYPSKTHALMFEVRNDAGFHANRSCDAIAMGLWPSRGLKLAGFEIKRSRADWLKEYREPEKAEAFQQFCDEWWIVAASMSIVEPDELPENWGLLVAHGSRLTCQKQAPKLTPAPLDRGILAAMFKRAIEQGARPAKDAHDRGFQAGQEYQRKISKDVTESVRRDLESLRRRVYEFEAASGISLHSSTGAEVGAAVSLVRRGGHRHFARPIASMLQNAEALVDQLKQMEKAASLEVPAEASAT